MGTRQQWVVGMIYIGNDKNPPLRNDICRGMPVPGKNTSRIAMQYLHNPFLYLHGARTGAR